MKKKKKTNKQTYMNSSLTSASFRFDKSSSRETWWQRRDSPEPVRSLTCPHSRSSRPVDYSSSLFVKPALKNLFFFS